MWLFFALLAPIMLAVNNILDKFILTKKLRNPYSFNILTMMFDLVPLFLIVIIFPISFGIFALAGIFVGLMIVPALYLYNKAIMFEEASRVGSLTYIYPIFTTLLAFVFLGETLGATEYAGVLLLVAGAILISYRKKSGKFIVSAAIFLMLAYSFLWAVDSIITDYSLSYFDFWSFYAWSLVGSFFGGLLMLIPGKARRTFSNDARNSKGALPMIFVTSCVFYIGELAFMAALALGSPSLTSALSSTQPLFTLIFASFLSVFYPHILKEETDMMSMAAKIAAIIMIISGSYLVIA